MIPRKGQISQVFIYVTTLLIVALVLFYGYRAISTFKERADQVSFIQMKNDIENAIESISVDYGSVKTREISLPIDVREVCIVSSYPGLPDLSGTQYPLIEDSVNSRVMKNIFLIGQQNAGESFYVEKIYIEDDILCVPSISNKLVLKMEGMGNHAVVSPG